MAIPTLLFGIPCTPFLVEHLKIFLAQYETITQVLLTHNLIRSQLFGLPLEKNSSLKQKISSIGNGQSLLHIVVGNQNTDIAILQLPHDMLNIFYRYRVDTRKRFIQHYELRINGQTACDLSTAALASRQLVTFILAHLSKTKLLDETFQTRQLLFARQLGHLQHRHNVIFDAHLAEYAGLLWQIADTGSSAFNSTNSELSTGVAPDYTIISGLTFDSRGSLWLLNSYSPDRNIIEIKPTGEWVSHFQQGLMEGNQSFLFMRSALFDTRGRLWFVNSHWGLPALICYEPGTDKLKVIRNFVNQDGATLTVTHVRGVTEDREGNLWISTNIGPLALGIEETGKESPVFTQVKVPRNDGSNLADYLLSGVDITCMAIDGANRKWMGTNGSGVYLIGSDNIQEVRHFTRANSPLLSDNVESLAIDGKTGRLFIATDKGLCSYVTDATDPADEMLSDNVYAYPNPVRPDYTGPITITGLSYDADVKIVTVDGTLVHQGRSLGGSYTWDGRDRQGRRVAGGVYSVLTATNDGRKGTVCKIAIVR